MISERQDHTFSQFQTMWETTMYQKYHSDSQFLASLKKKQRDTEARGETENAYLMKQDIEELEKTEAEKSDQLYLHDYKASHARLQRKFDKEIQCFNNERKQQRQFLVSRTQRIKAPMIIKPISQHSSASHSRVFQSQPSQNSFKNTLLAPQPQLEQYRTDDPSKMPDESLENNKNEASNINTNADEDLNEEETASNENSLVFTKGNCMASSSSGITSEQMRKQFEYDQNDTGNEEEAFTEEEQKIEDSILHDKSTEQIPDQVENKNENENINDAQEDEEETKNDNNESKQEGETKNDDNESKQEEETKNDDNESKQEEETKNDNNESKQEEEGPIESIKSDKENQNESTNDGFEDENSTQNPIDASVEKPPEDSQNQKEAIEREITNQEPLRSKEEEKGTVYQPPNIDSKTDVVSNISTENDPKIDNAQTELPPKDNELQQTTNEYSYEEVVVEEEEEEENFESNEIQSQSTNQSPQNEAVDNAHKETLQNITAAGDDDDFESDTDHVINETGDQNQNNNNLVEPLINPVELNSTQVQDDQPIENNNIPPENLEQNQNKESEEGKVEEPNQEKAGVLEETFNMFGNALFGNNDVTPIDRNLVQQPEDSIPEDDTSKNEDHAQKNNDPTPQNETKNQNNEEIEPIQTVDINEVTKTGDKITSEELTNEEKITITNNKTEDGNNSNEDQVTQSTNGTITSEEEANIETANIEPQNKNDDYEEETKNEENKINAPEAENDNGKSNLDIILNTNGDVQNEDPEKSKTDVEITSEEQNLPSNEIQDDFINNQVNNQNQLENNTPPTEQPKDNLTLNDDEFSDPDDVEEGAENVEVNQETSQTDLEFEPEPSQDQKENENAGLDHQNPETSVSNEPNQDPATTEEYQEPPPEEQNSDENNENMPNYANLIASALLDDDEDDEEEEEEDDDDEFTDDDE